MDPKINLNHTLAIDSPFQTFAVGLLVEFIDWLHHQKRFPSSNQGFLYREQREDRDREKDKSEQFEEEDKKYQHLPLLAVQLPQGTAFS